MNKNIYILIISLFCSCNSNYKLNTENKSEAILIKKTINQVLQVENLNKKDFNSDVFFHVSYENLNNGYYLTKVALNNLAPKGYSNKTHFNEFEIFIYRNNAMDEGFTNDVFFVPDSRSWFFLVYVKKNEIVYIKNLENYESNKIDDDDFKI